MMRSRPNCGARATIGAGVHFTEFGIPEAMWHLRLNGWAAIITMQAHGISLHANVKLEIAKLAELQQPRSVLLE